MYGLPRLRRPGKAHKLILKLSAFRCCTDPQARSVVFGDFREDRVNRERKSFLRRLILDSSLRSEAWQMYRWGESPLLISCRRWSFVCCQVLHSKLSPQSDDEGKSLKPIL